MKKLAIDLAAPVSCTPMASTAPRMMGIPRLPKVLPKPVVIKVRVSIKEYPSVPKIPRVTPKPNATTNRDITGLSFTFVMSSISAMMAMTRRTRNPIADMVVALLSKCKRPAEPVLPDGGRRKRDRFQATHEMAQSAPEKQTANPQNFIQYFSTQVNSKIWRCSMTEIFPPFAFWLKSRTAFCYMERTVKMLLNNQKSR